VLRTLLSHLFIFDDQGATMGIARSALQSGALPWGKRHPASVARRLAVVNEEIQREPFRS
jgi:hypothetical protein